MAQDWPLLYHVLDDFSEPWRAEPAPAVLLHHGLAGNGNLFRAWVPSFANRYRVLRIDARGQGRSPLPDGYAFSLDGFVNDTLAVMDHLSIQRAHWIGTSGGGIIGQHAAVVAPARFASLTLVATTARFRGPAIGVDQWLAPLDRGDTDEFFRQDIVTRFGLEAPERADWIINEIQRTPPETIAALHRWVVGVDLSEAIRAITCPALIVTGEHDTLMDMSDAQLLADRIPNARIHVVEGHPHNVGYTHPALVGGVVRRFIDSVEDGTATGDASSGAAYLSASGAPDVTAEEARTIGALSGLDLSGDRARQLAGTLSAFLGQQERLRALDTGDREPAVMTFESEQST
ncbi:MAG TPA: alpha/beta fold hydrolase [Thermomicrobiales bacterium]|nr:alpha/beta fold hydrolase [Thermomicrobiales bacterium]